MSDGIPENIIDLKIKIRDMLSNLRSNSQNELTKENILIKKIHKYKVVNKGELERLSKKFNNILNPIQAESSDS